MLKNYLKVALRNLRKNKTYSIINISGLAIGMACFIFAALYIQYERSFDKYHRNGDQIYRIILNCGSAYQGKTEMNITPGPLVPALKAECPEIVYGSRVFQEGLLKELPQPLIKYGEKSFLEKKFFYVDPDFLSMFDFPLISGNPKTALSNPYSVLITEEIAKKYFGNSSPVGKSITMNGKNQYLVTGILKNVPKNSHFTFDFLCSFSTLYSSNDMGSWGNCNYKSYIQLRPGASITDIETKLNKISERHKETDMKMVYKLEQLYRIHLYGDHNFEIENNGNYQNLYLFAAVGFSILLIACFNYVNISTAGSVKRSKEVGLRKVVGANRIQLVRQFLVESLVISLSGFCVAIFLVEILLPVFNTYMNTNIRFSFFLDFKMMLGLLGVFLVTGCLAGSYPAFFASKFQPVYILKSGAKRGFGSIQLRNIFVVIQFSISAILIFGTITVYKQLQFIKNKNLGFKKDHIVTVPLNVADNNIHKNYKSFVNQLRLNPQVLGITASDCLPYEIRSYSTSSWDGKANNERFEVYRICADYSFLDLYGIPLLTGDKSSWDRYGDKNIFLLNRTAQQVLGWKNPVGKRFGCDRISKENGIIVGVAEDFHYYPLHYQIKPLVMELINPEKGNTNINYLSIKINSANISGTLSYIENKWKQFSDYPFEFQFLDDQVDVMYRSEQRLGQLFKFFTALAIIIGCLGLYGLITFSIEQKIKEIGIRKILGASVSQVVNLLLKEIIICIVIANLCALPVSWYWMNKWLQDFAYRIDISLLTFALSGSIALVIAVTTVSLQAIKAATANPVESLKYE